MAETTEIRRVALVGGGVIGSGWAARCLAHGLDVVATDPGSGAEEKIRAGVANAWPALTRVGLKPGASQDRLSFAPSLEAAVAEADFMRRALAPSKFATWLRAFLPQILENGRTDWLAPGIVTDRDDPKLAHLDGLNLSRAWMLEGIASALPKGDKRLTAIVGAAESHKRAGLAAVTGEHYEGGHWLGSFAVYLVTKRGISGN